VHYAAASLNVLLSTLLLALASCGRDARRSHAPMATATATRARSDQAHVPAPASPSPTPSGHVGPGPSSPTGNPCPAIAFFSGVMIDVHPHESWPAGKYRFVIRHDGKTTICNGRTPLPPGEQLINIVCSSSSGVVWEDGRFEIHSYPALVDIVVVRDGVRLAHVHRKLEYEVHSPHGPECPSFRSAGFTLKP
jgi:hypothetical protein